MKNFTSEESIKGISFSVTTSAFNLDISLSGNKPTGIHRSKTKTERFSGKFRMILLLLVSAVFWANISLGQTISTGTITGSPFCVSATTSTPVSVHFTVNGTFNSGNVFTAQLSDANGSFASPTSIGTLVDINAGTISATIPPGTPEGNGYRIRVDGSNPTTTGFDNGTGLVIHSTPTAPGSASISPPSVCSGETRTFTLTATGGSAGSSGGEMKWYEGSCETGTFIGTGNNLSVTRTLTSNTTFYCRWESISCGNSNCASATVTVNDNPTPPTSAAVTPATVCSGASTTFTLTATGGSAGGSGGELKWYEGGCGTGSSIGSGNSITVTRTLTSNTTFYCRWESISCGNSGCASAAVTVNPILPVSLYITASSTNICEGTNVTFSAHPTNGGTTPIYQWNRNGSPITEATGETYTTNTLVNGDKITLTMTSTATCPNPAAVTSEELTITVNPNLEPSVTIEESANPVCAGSPVTFTATPVNGGSTPLYQWKVNGANAGTNNPVYTYTPNTGDQVSVTMTTSATCRTKNNDDSNIISMVVNPMVTPSVTVSASTNHFCPGTSVTFTATPTHGGTVPSYQWKINGTPVGSNSSSFVSSTLNNGDQVSVTLTSNAPCVTTTTATANITMVVNPGTPSVPSGISGMTAVCPGTSQNYSVTPDPAATTYTWTLPTGWSLVSGQGTNSIAVTAGNYGQNGTIAVTAGNVCGTSPARTLSVAVNPGTPAQPAAISGSPEVCPNTSNHTYSITPVSGATNYTWSVPSDWTINSGQNGTVITVTSGNSGNGNITVTASNSCGTSLAQSLSVLVKAGTPSAPTAITGTAAVCPGTSVTYSVTSDPNATSYNWIVPAGWNITSGQGSNSITVTSGSSGQNGTLSVTASNSCGTSSPSTLNVTVNPGAPATPGAITGSNDQCISKTGQIYSIVPVPYATSYTWILPSGWSITSGDHTNSITVSISAAAVSGTISVVATNSCGTSAPAELYCSITQTEPTTPGPINGMTAICPSKSPTYSIDSVSGANYYTWHVPQNWSILSGDGTTQITALAPQNAQSGDITVIATNTCGTSNASVLSITVASTATVYAGADITVCYGTASVQLNGAVGGAIKPNQDKEWDWISLSGGYFSNPSSLTTTYYFPNGSNTSGVLKVVIKSNVNKVGCAFTTDTMSITILQSPTASVSAITPVCEGQSSDVTFTATPNTLLTYKKNSGTDETISIGSTGSATLQTGPLTAGTTTYTLVKVAYTDLSSCSTTNLSSNVVINVNEAATINAGPDHTICSAETFTMQGSFGGGATSATWSTSGNGTFSSNAPNAVYTPGSADLLAGSVTLTYTSEDPSGPCGFVSDQMVLTINPAPTVEAGGDLETCQSDNPSPIVLTGASFAVATSAAWSITSGGGALSTAAFTSSPATVTYTPQTGFTGTVILILTTNDPDGPCSAVSDTRAINVNPAPAVQAGDDQGICAGSTVALSGSITSPATLCTWIGGEGNFNPDRNTLNATYTPNGAEVLAGTVTLTLTTDDPAGPCGAVSDQMVITIWPEATAQAGPDQTICSGSTVTLNGSVGGGATSGSWTGGNGTFTPDANTATATYAPTLAEIAAGSVTLTLTTNDPVGLCTAVTDEMIVTINAAATVDAGPDQEICSGTTATLSGTYGGGATSVTWTGGNGTFTPDANTETATYAPTPAEIAAGSVTLTLTTNDPDGPCGAVSDVMLITIEKAVVITTQPVNTGICANKGDATLSVAASGTITGYQWYKGIPPSGTVVPEGGNISGTITSILRFSPATLLDDGTYYAVIKGKTPCSDITSGIASLNVDETIIISTPPLPQTVCEGGPVTFSVTATPADGLQYQWKHGGTPIEGANSATYSIQHAALANAGNYSVEITGPTGYTCSSAESVNALLTVIPTPVVDQPDDFTFCSGTTTSPIVFTGGAAGTVYNWTNNNTAIGLGASGQGNIPAFTAANSGTTSLTATITVTPAIEQGGVTCTGTPKIFTITLNPLPVPTLTGNTSICQNSTGNVYSTEGGMSDYEWIVSAAGTITAGGGTNDNTVTVTWSTDGAQTISVNYANSNGCRAASPTIYNVTVNPLPVITLAGPSPVCRNSTGNVYTTQPGMSNYIWAVPSGGEITAGGTSTDHTVTVKWNSAGNHSVTVNYTDPNSCTAASPTSYPVLVNELPVPTITGPPEVCLNSTITYTTEANMTEYTWTVVTGGTITSGAGTSSINITWVSTGSHTVSVSYTHSNGCTSETPTIYNVTVNQLPSPAITGPESVCLNSTGNIYTTDPGMNSYIWSITGGSITSGGNGNNSATVTWTSPGTQAISVNYTNSDGCQSPDPGDLSVEVSPPSAGGTIDPVNDDHCAGIGNGTITVLGQTGSVTRWECSTDGLTWSLAPGSTPSPTYNYHIFVPTRFRAIVKSGECPEVRSPVSAITVIPDLMPHILTPPPIMCPGEPVTLVGQVTTSTGTIINPGSFTGGDFASSNPEGWDVDGGSIPFPAAADNRAAGPWGITNAHFHNPREFSGIWYATSSTSTDNKIAIANGQWPVTTVETPVFSLLGGDDPVLEFEMGYHLMAGCFAKIEISVNGGLSYTDLLVIHTPLQGTLDYGTGTGATQATPRILKDFELDLSDFIDQQNLRLRFYYTSTQPGSSWAIDNLNVPPGSFTPITYDWEPDESLTPSDGQTVVANPTETTTYTLYTRLGDCEEVTPVTVLVSVLPLDLTWTGAQNNQEWFNPNNYNEHFYPRHCTNVHIPGGLNYYPDIDENNAVCLNLYIEPKGKLTISPTGILTMDGVASIESDSETRNGSMIVYGNLTSKQTGDYVTYHRFLNTGRYYMVSSPVTTSAFNTNASLIKNRTDGTTKAFGFYQEEGNIGPTYYGINSIPQALTNGKGYYIFTEASRTIPFSGALNKGTITTPVQRSTIRKGWNAVGNPYTSAIGITTDAGTDESFIQKNITPLHEAYAAVYLWNNNSYKVVCNSGYQPIYYPGATAYNGPDPQFAQVGQAFLVCVDEFELEPPYTYDDPNFKPTNTLITFTPKMQTHAMEALLKSARKSWPGVTLLVNSGDQTRYTMVGFNENMTTGLDKSFDAGQFTMDKFKIYTHLVTDDKEIDFEIQSLPDNRYDQLEVPVGVDLSQGGNLTFRADGVILPDGVYPILEDRQLKVKTMLKTVADAYTVSVPAQTAGIGRFYLSFGNLTPVEEVTRPEPRYSAWFADRKIIIYGSVPREATAILYDLNGRILGHYPLLKENRNEIAAQHLANGMYILHIQGETGTQVMKVVVVYE